MNIPPAQPNSNTDGLDNKNANNATGQQLPTPNNDLTPSTPNTNITSAATPAQADSAGTPVGDHNPQGRLASTLTRNATNVAPRNAAAGAAGNPTALAPRPPRFSRRRIVIWLIELVVLLAATEHFILKPRLARSRAEKAQAARAAKLEQEVQEVIRPLAERARGLPGLSEVFPAYLAPLTGLADGSKNMRDTQLSISEQEGLPIEVVNSIGMAFRLVPAGTGLIGSPPDEPGRGSIEMQHVMIFPHHFYVGKHEVTQAQWRQVMGEKNNPSHYFGDSRPVEEVSWYDALRFTNALCEREGLPLGTYRLPSESEWEYACRAGTITAYCFGNDPKHLDLWADYADNNYQSTRNVGQRRPNALGLYDMHGNVWEWCLNKYANYPGDETSEAEFHQWPTIRGGNWHVAAPECRSANRCRLPGASVGNMLGFRIIRTITNSTAAAQNSPSADTDTAKNGSPPAGR